MKSVITRNTSDCLYILSENIDQLCSLTMLHYISILSLWLLCVQTLPVYYQSVMFSDHITSLFSHGHCSYCVCRLKQAVIGLHDNNSINK